MGRPTDPRGRDKSRSITLTGDVAEIAQKLADSGQLSRVLSDLLMKEYGLSKTEQINAKIDGLKAEKAQMDQELRSLFQKLSEAEAIEHELAIQNRLAHQAEERRKEKVQALIDDKEKDIQKFIKKARSVERKIQSGKILNEHGFSLAKQKENYSKTIEDIRKEIKIMSEELL